MYNSFITLHKTSYGVLFVNTDDLKGIEPIYNDDDSERCCRIFFADTCEKVKETSSEITKRVALIDTFDEEDKLYELREKCNVKVPNDCVEQFIAYCNAHEVYPSGGALTNDGLFQYIYLDD